MLFLLIVLHLPSSFSFFFFNDTATTEIYTLSLHDALPISLPKVSEPAFRKNVNSLPSIVPRATSPPTPATSGTDRKSTRLNSSHSQISYAVFCLKKKKKQQHIKMSTQSSDIRLSTYQMRVY